MFVYGTLRRGEGNFALLMNAHCVAEQARIRARMYDTSLGWPSVVLDESTYTYGEVYEVDEHTLNLLDELEGYRGPEADNDYHRVSVYVETDRGSMEALVYVYTAVQVSTFPEISYGDWRVARLLTEREEWMFFAYGSVMDSARLIEAEIYSEFQEVVGRGELDGYSLAFTRLSHDGARADVVETGGRVEGKVYHIGRRALDYLLLREGVYRAVYRPAVVEVAVLGERLRDVLIFLVVDKRPEAAPPVWYRDEILRGGAGLLSAEYLSFVRKKISALERSR